jgi:hypothetical protein
MDAEVKQAVSDFIYQQHSEFFEKDIKRLVTCATRVSMRAVAG